MKISACLIVKNEELHIEESLKSLDFVDEIIVVDSGSSDKTVEIAKKYTDKVYYQEWLGFGEQRKFAENKAKNEWILAIDGDEFVSKELIEEIKNINENDNFAAYKIAVKNHFINKWMKHGGLGRLWVTRLYNKKKCYWESIIHEGLNINGNVGKLKNKIMHYMYDSAEEILIKNNLYSTLEAEKMLKLKKPNFIKVLFYPSLIFIHKYIFQLGFLDGRNGYMWAFSLAYYHRIKFSKYKTMIRKNKIKEKDDI